MSDSNLTFKSASMFLWGFDKPLSNYYKLNAALPVKLESYAEYNYCSCDLTANDPSALPYILGFKSSKDSVFFDDLQRRIVAIYEGHLNRPNDEYELNSPIPALNLKTRWNILKLITKYEVESNITVTIVD